jgi:hypothetical protein
MTKYNGHKNWNHWNVSLWINNDEGLYRMALAAISRHRGKRGAREAAAYSMLALLPSHTPDGAPYSVSSIRAAMVGMQD